MFQSNTKVTMKVKLTKWSLFFKITTHVVVKKKCFTFKYVSKIREISQKISIFELHEDKVKNSSLVASSNNNIHKLNIKKFFTLEKT